MTDVFRVDRRRSPLVAFAIAMLLAATQAAAEGDESVSPQPSGPVRLMPPAEPSAPAPRSMEKSSVADKARAPTSIEVEGLRAIDPDSVGTLTSGNGGLGADMWSGTSRGFIAMLLSRIPAPIKSPALRSLARRLLLSVGQVPPSKQGRESRTSLIAKRIERLRALGLVEEAGTLLEASPARTRVAALIRLSLDQMIFEGKYDEACIEVLRDTRRRTDWDWQRLTVFCQFRDGQTEAGTFGASILAESAGFDDRPFLALADRLGGVNDVRLKNLPNPTPIHLAMIREAKIPVPADVVKSDSPVVLRLVALRDDVDEGMRLEAAERAAKMGAISPDKLGAIYEGVDLPAAEIERALSIADKQQSPRARALLYRAAQMQTVATAKAAVLRAAFEAAQAAELMPLTVHLYLPMIRDLPATGALAWFAGDAIRALLAAGAVEAARPWLLMVKQRALRDETARRLRDRLWAFAVLAGEAGSAANEPTSMEAWFAALKESDAETAAAKADMALSLMNGLGLFPPDGFHERLLALPPGKRKAAVPPPGVLQTLAQAAARRRLGETVSLALIALDGTTTDEVDAYLMGEVVKGLAGVGLTREAQVLALETASAAGL